MEKPFAADTTAPAPAAQAPRSFNPFAATRAVLASRTLSTAERLVALAVINHADRLGTAFPGRALLAAETSLSLRGLTKALRALAAGGVLRWTPRRTTDGDRDTNLYEVTLPEAWGVGTSVPHRREVSSPPVGTSVPEGRDLSAHKHPNEHPIGTAHAKGGEAPPPAPCSGPNKKEDMEVMDWGVIVGKHRELRRRDYGTEGADEPVPAENRRAVLKLFAEQAEMVADTWNTIPNCNATRDQAFEYVVKEILEKWFEKDGRDDYLTDRAHPLRALRDDLTNVVWEWHPEWKAYVERTRLKQGVAAVS